MKILVSDTSVLIDLERGSLLDSCFGLPWQISVPDLLFKRELADYNGAALLKLGLVVEPLTSDELSMVQTARQVTRALSLADAYAYCLARNRNWPLLTGDGALRRIAESEKVECHGVLWVLDQLFERNLVTGTVIADGLETMVLHPRCRLPRPDVLSRVRRYRKLK